ncbi:threonine ammonia-lyase, partial [Megasphaera cerevisiae]|uniref:threonine ammonia-lyase n=3 Tax=Megasphaera cerevisiae TaxID=39029 RepID=UPI00117E64C5
MAGCNVYLELENLQRTGSFKLRGAYNKVAALTPEERNKGVIAASAGNHAQGVALAASVYGCQSTICMPRHAPLTKVAATRGYGANVVLHGDFFDEAAAKAVALTKEHGYTFVHPFNDPLVIAGQGTISLEILEELPDV